MGIFDGVVCMNHGTWTIVAVAREGSDLTLKVDEEVVRLPVSDNFNRVFRHSCHVKGHSSTRSEGVGSYFMQIECQFLEAYFVGFEVEGGCDLSARYRCGHCGRWRVYPVDGSVGWRRTGPSEG